MKSSQGITFLLALAVSASLSIDVNAQSGNASSGSGISMIMYPVVRGTDGKQYLITPSGKQVTVPGLVISQNATQVPVYRDQANHFWYTNKSGQQVAVAPVQLEAVQAQINAQSGGGGMPPQMVPPTQSVYSSTPAYSGGYNGIPYGTPVNMDGPGRYSYTPAGGNKQYVTPTPAMSGQMNQWQQQVPYGQQSNSASSHQSSHSYSGGSRMDMRRDRRASRLDSRSQNQSSNAANDRDYADSKMESGQVLGTGMRSRRSAREERRSNRSDRRADRLQGN
jgi:hypothetical protein